jgi:hypothetical protein
VHQLIGALGRAGSTVPLRLSARRDVGGKGSSPGLLQGRLALDRFRCIHRVFAVAGRARGEGSPAAAARGGGSRSPM